MSQGVQVVGLYVRDHDEALAFYVEKLGFRVHTDVRNGDYRWLTVQHPEQPSFQLGLFTPGPPVLDAATAQTLRAIVAKGAMPPLVLVVDDCRAAWDRMRARGVELTQEPVDRFGTVDAGFRDPSGNGWKMIQVRDMCNHFYIGRSASGSAQGVTMNWNMSVRQIHRWFSIAFTVTVIANFVALARAGGGMPPPWVTYSPLLPLAFLMLTGLYL